MKILDELWHGNVKPSERKMSSNSEQYELVKYIARHEGALLPMLSDEARETYEKLWACKSELSSLNELEALFRDFSSVQGLCLRRWRWAVMSKMTVLVVEPEKKPYVKEIDNTLESLQREVGGYIQTVYPRPEPCGLVCWEESKMYGAPLNRALRDENGEVYDIIAGTFLIVGLTEDDFGSLSAESIKQFSELFKSSETFINIDGRIITVPIE